MALGGGYRPGGYGWSGLYVAGFFQMGTVKKKKTKLRESGDFRHWQDDKPWEVCRYVWLAAGSGRGCTGKGQMEVAKGLWAEENGFLEEA